MTKFHLSGMRVLLAWLLASVATVGVVCAQDDGEPEPDEAVRRAVLAQRKLERAMERDQQEAQQKLRARFEVTLKSRVEKLDRRHGLSEAQKSKLLVAGRADIDRYFDRVQELEKRLALAHPDRLELLIERDAIAMRNLYPSQDIFDERSLLSKILSRTLTKEQAATYQTLEREIAVQRHRATLEWVLGTWDQTLKLSTDQRRRLAVLLHEQTRPPRKNGEYDYYGVLLQLSKLPENTLKAHFTDAQWAAVSKHLVAARGLEETLKTGGYLPTDDVAAVPDRGVDPVVKADKKRG